MGLAILLLGAIGNYVKSRRKGQVEAPPVELEDIRGVLDEGPR